MFKFLTKKLVVIYFSALNLLTAEVYAETTKEVIADKFKIETFNFGELITEEEIAPYDITIFPSGKNLPTGQGSVKQGRQLYGTQCAMCHGDSGIEGPAARLAGSDGWFAFNDPLRILRIDKYPILLISVGSLWPQATSILDYIRRAMPHYAPKSLTNNESYALTAYILNLNNLIDDDAVLDQNNILLVSMPAKERNFISPILEGM